MTDAKYHTIQQRLNRLWYDKPKSCAWALVPFSWAYGVVASMRQYCIRKWYCTQFDVPVVVVGNLTVGGVGKTPLVIALANRLKACGYRVGIVSRGYGAKTQVFPHEISAQDTADKVGDEPLLIAQKTKVPVVISPKRVQAVAYLVKQHQVEVVISDDGLQHAAMGRSIEIAVIDGARKFGNGFMLPAGPLREPASRLQSVDMAVCNGGELRDTFAMQIKPQAIYPTALPKDASIAAIAGIGHPKRFFDTLSKLNLTYRAYAFSDHHVFCASDLDVAEDVIIMTEKDSVKCQGLTKKPLYVLPIEAELPDAFWSRFMDLLEQSQKTHETT